MLATMSGGKKKLPKLSREKWLEMAITTMADKCKFKFNLDSLLSAMPVTKGSFYNHFKNRGDFLQALVEYWERHETKSVIESLKGLPESMSAEDRLWELTQTIHDLDLDRYELLIRTLEFEHLETHAAIKKVDRRRIDTVRDLFSEMGFSGAELEARTRVYVTAISQENTILDKIPEDEQEDFRKARHEFFTRP
jgi:AcrR family transcriptional regulator